VDSGIDITTASYESGTTKSTASNLMRVIRVERDYFARLQAASITANKGIRTAAQNISATSEGEKGNMTYSNIYRLFSVMEANMEKAGLGVNFQVI